MQFDYSRIFPFVFAGLAILLVYRRLRRSFGRQLVRPVAMRIRIGILALLACSLVPVALSDGRFMAAEIGAVLAGIALALWGARRTRFQTYQGRLHYLPHTYTGIAVSLLFVGRLAYRMVEIYSARHVGDGAGAASLQSFEQPEMANSPLTVALLSVVIGYYICYYSWVLRRSKRISPEDLEVVETPTAAVS